MEAGNHSQSSSSQGNGKQRRDADVSRPPLVEDTQFSDNDQDELNVRLLLTVMRRRAAIILGVAVAVTSAACLWTFSQVPKYEGKFQVLVEPVSTEGQLTKLTKLTDQLPGVNPDDIKSSNLDYATQIQVLRSPKLMSGLIKQLQTKYPDVTYESLITKKQLKINRLEETKILEVRFRDEDRQKINFVLDQVAKNYLRYSLEERQTNLSQGIRFVENQLPKLQQRVDKLQGQLQTFRQRYNLLDPEEQAKQLTERVSTIAQEQINTQVKLNETRSLYATLQKQLGMQPNQALAAAALSEAPRYQQLLNQLQEVETKIAAESARFLDESPTMLALQDQRQNLLPLLRRESQRVLGNSLSGINTNPEALSSPSSVRLELIKQYVDAANQLQVLQVRGAAINQTVNRLNQEVRVLPIIARQYTDLQRQLTVATNSFNRFLDVRETLQIEAAQKALPWQIIYAPETPEEPIFPKPVQNVILGALAGLILGVAAALLTERLDNVFHSPDELKEATKLPLLGVIPYQKELKNQKPLVEMVVSSQSHSEQDQLKTRSNRKTLQWYNSSPFLESFRSLHTNIRFLGSDTSIHSLVISSSVPSDGKSTVSVHLAQAAAAMGQRVLLVDADLRRPQVHNVLGLPNNQGLSNVIATGLTPKDAIQRLPAWDNLYVLTSGQIPPDATRLLSSKRMQYLMEQLRAVFDLVIYDTPPVMGLADGRLLAAHTDGVILVVRLGKTDRSIVMQTLDALKISSAPVLGIVANSAKGNNSGSYYYYQQYYTQDSEMEKAKKLLQKRINSQ